MVHRLLTPRAWKRSPSSILDTKDSWSNRPTERGVLKVWRCRLELAPQKRCSIRSEHEWELQIFSSKLTSRFKHPQQAGCLLAITSIQCLIQVCHADTCRMQVLACAKAHVGSILHLVTYFGSRQSKVLPNRRYWKRANMFKQIYVV